MEVKLELVGDNESRTAEAVAAIRDIAKPESLSMIGVRMVEFERSAK